MLIVKRPHDTNACSPIDVQNLSLRLLADEQRVILLSFTSGDKHQLQTVFEFLDQLSDADAAAELEQMQKRYAGRHADFTERLLENYEKAKSFSGLELRNHKR